MATRLEFLKTFLITVVLTAVWLPVNAQAWSVRVLAGNGVAGELVRASENWVKSSGNSLIARLDGESARQLALDSLLDKSVNPAKRLQGANLILLLRSRGKLVTAQLVSVSRAEIVGVEAISGATAVTGALTRLFADADKVLTVVTPVASGPKGKWLETVARGYGRSGMPAAVASRVALIDAKRNAVQKILGATVNLNEVGDRKKVESTTQGTLKSEIINEGSDSIGNWVEIRARVFVPQSLLDQAPAQAGMPARSGYKPLVIKSSAGSINWDKGVILANGKANVRKGDKLGARRAAIVDAQANALKLARSMALDSSKKVGDAAASDQVLALKLSGLVRNGEVKSTKVAGNQVTVVYEVPLHGVTGIQTAFVGTVTPMAFDVADQVPAKGDTGVVIDLRGTGATASLFPKIVDADGGVQFDPTKDMDPAARQARGFAAFAVAADTGWFLKNGWPVIEGQLITSDTIQLASSGLWGNDGEPVLMAASRRRHSNQRVHRRRRRRRQGRRPWTIKARARGRIPANIVFSTRQKDRKTFYARLTRSLRAGRVVILMDTAVGGVEGRLLLPLRLARLR